MIDVAAIIGSLPRLQHAIWEVSRYLEQTGINRRKWDAMSEDELWRELVGCILGSRVRFAVAYAAVERMDMAGLFSSLRRYSSDDEYERDVLRALIETGGSGDVNGLQGRYPFPRMRAKQVRVAKGTIYANGGTICRFLGGAADVREARRYLSAEVAGLGPKQASLFLRNVGYSSRVAVLDVHVLAYMNWIGLTPVPLRAVRTIREYESLEEAFVEHSCIAGFPPDLYDIAVWVVIRMAKKESRLCRW